MFKLILLIVSSPYTLYYILQEADFSIGPFVLSLARAEAVDYTPYLMGSNRRIVSRRGRPEADPWGFLLPLSPLVWTAILASLLGILMAMIGLSFLTLWSSAIGKWMTDTLNLIRIILQQGKRNIKFIKHL